MSDYGKYGMPSKKKGHGAKGYWIVGEGYYEQDGSDQPAPEPGYGEMPDEVPPESMMKFCRLFPDLAPFRPERSALEALGATMANAGNIGTAQDVPPDSPIPAGFTYFGQFVDHDISRTPASVGGAIGDGQPADPGKNERTASLDLDALYGGGPGDPNSPFYEGDGVHFKIGTADEIGVHNAPELPNDLPRAPKAGQVPQPAQIGDHRNDENLAVAQTHLSLLKFHNKVVDDPTAPSSFDDVRRTVRQHYQSIVLHDFVSRLVDPGVYDKVMKNGREWYMPGGADGPGTLCMPVEFSVAAYRLGHTMVRNTYEWNRVFRSGGQVGRATLVNLFQFSEVSGNFTPGSPNGQGAPRLPANWVANWLLLHDFSTVDGVSSDAALNFARPLNTVLAEKLAELEEFAGVPEPALRHLAVRNLLRGSQLGLPTGQDVAARLGVDALSPADVASGPHADVIAENGFAARTPLWYYILKEAEVDHGGQHLGKVGSTIVMETFHGLIEGSEDSILATANWAPSLPSAAPDKFTMADMLVYVDDLNPLGDLSA